MTSSGQELERVLTQERSFLVRLAHAQLRDPQKAEDAVQETALAAWQGIAQFQGRSSIRTWLVGILRFKILDLLREGQKQALALSYLDVSEELSALDDDLLFDAQGRWNDEPQAWWRSTQEPSEQLHEKQVMQGLQACLQKLPEKTAQVFLMKEYLGLETAEISAETSLQSGHIRVILMRARLALRTCLEWTLQSDDDGIRP